MTSRLTIPSGGNGLSGSSSYYGASTPASASYTSGSSLSISMSVFQYIVRLFDVSQMDLQSALDQMLSLLSCGNPLSSLLSSSASTTSSSHYHQSIQKVYKLAYYRKQTKNHWARDDPAFVAVQILLLAISSLAYCIAFRTDGIFMNTLTFGFYSIVVNYLGVGLLMASIGRAVANAHLLTTASSTTTATGANNSVSTTQSSSSLHVRQTVEFMYAFDIHCNAFFPLFIMLYGVQFFLLPIVLGRNFMAFLISNVLYSVAFGWYFYVTHLGYRALPFLSNTEIFLFPIAGVLFLFILNLIGYPFGFGWNASRIMAHLYFET